MQTIFQFKFPVQPVQSYSESKGMRRTYAAMARGGDLNEGIFCDPANMVAEIDATLGLRAVAWGLAANQVGLPHGSACLADDPGSGFDSKMTIRQAIDWNLPHLLEGKFGNWTDWILGMTIRLADGTVSKSGSRVVKNVAGYDAHKLLVGARGTLGTILRVAVRIYPISSIQYYSTLALAGADLRNLQSCWEKSDVHIFRVLPSDFESAREQYGDCILYALESSQTLWLSQKPEAIPGSWVRTFSKGKEQLPELPELDRRLLQRMKSVFDPNGKLPSWEATFVR